MKQFFATLLALIVLAGCQGHVEKNYNLVQVDNGLEYEDKFTLKAAGDITLPLDKQTGFYQSSVYYKELNGQKIYSFINRLNNSVYWFDLASQKQVKRIDLAVEGPHGVGPLQVADHLIDDDGNLLVYNTNSGLLFRVNQQGEILRKYALYDIKGETEASFPNPSSTRKMVLIGNDLYIPCEILRRRTSYTDISALLKVDLESGEFNYQMQYPEAYNLGFWGAIFKFQPSLAYNPNTENFVVNFPVDPNLHLVTTEGDKLEKTYVGSKFIKTFGPLTSDIKYGVRMDPNSADKRSEEYSLSHSDYSSIVYDPHNNLYYRYVANRPSIERLKLGDRAPEYSIIILNDKLKKLGEIRLDKKQYYASMSVVTPEGIVIPRLDLYGENEDVLVFDILKLKTLGDAYAYNN